MNNAVNGKNNMSQSRNQNRSVAGRTVNPVNAAPTSKRPAVQKTPVNKAPSRPQAGHPAQSGRVHQTQAQRPVQRQIQRPTQNQGQRPVPQRVQRPVQKTAQKNVQKPVRKKATKKAAPKTEMNPMLIKLLGISAAILVAVMAVAGIISFLNGQYELLNSEITIEAGSSKPELNMYFKEEPAIPALVSSNLVFEEVNTDLPQTVKFNINMYGKNFPCQLVIKDSIAPTGEGVPQKIFSCEDLPDAMTCIANVNDVTDCTASWKDVPDMNLGGNFIVQAVLSDAAGNETIVGVPFEVTKDGTAPTITGAYDLQTYIGDTVTYRQRVTVTDDYDENPNLDIDTSAVNLKKAGKYDVVYRATDFSGNVSAVTVKIKVSEKPKGYIEPDVVYAEAKKILDEITEPGMTEEEIALQIIWWCRYNIKFILRTRSYSWTEAAHNAFTNRTGNCYSTASAVKALLDVAGIDNMMIERHPYQTATHFWNYVKINGQWYHCDATWRQGYDSYFFMYTTKELLNFWQGGWNGFQFKQSAFPESATESVQKRIDYKNHKIKS